MSYIKTSLLHSIRFIRLLLRQEQLELLAEPLVQLLRDLYQWRFMSFPFHSVDVLVDKLELSLDENDKDVLKRLELAMRKPDKYREAAQTLTPELVEKVLRLCEDELNTVSSTD